MGRAIKARRSRRVKSLSALSDEQLLDLRLCDLPLRIERSRVYPAIKQLLSELEAKGIGFRPHFWFSGEWFSPDGSPGIAVPFFLAHPRLLKLEKREMLEAEGETHLECLRILRHEAAHAIDSAYRLHFRKSWREAFGPYSKKYPKWYQPKPNSKSYVLHLDAWYAQAHPAEDWAETFAIWLTPHSRWRQRYRGWPALKKLEYVDQLMKEVAGMRPQVTKRSTLEPLPSLRMTLREYYRRKRSLYGTELPGFYDRDLRRIFSDDPRHGRRKAASQFIREVRGELRELVATWTGTPVYSIEQLLEDIMDRARELKLRLLNSEAQTRQELMLMLVVQTMNVIHLGRYRFAL